jgi:hypothetical protein
VTTHFFDREVLNGPGPASSPRIPPITSDLAKHFKDIQRIHCHLFVTENFQAEAIWTSGTGQEEYDPRQNGRQDGTSRRDMQNRTSRKGQSEQDT